MIAERPSLIDPAILIDPYPTFAWLRENDPIHWSAEVQAWVVTRHADVTSLYRDARLSADRIKVLVHMALQGGDTTPIKEYLRITGDMMLMRDNSEHHRLRVLGNRGFTPSALAAWQPRVTKVIDELLGQIGPDGRFDIVADLAEPMPSTVIAEMFGIPEADHGRFRDWADVLARFFGGTLRDPAAEARAANSAAVEFKNYFLKLYEERKRMPGDDLMSLFLAAEEAGRLSVAEVTSQCQLILVAGHVTTIDQLGNGVYAILRHQGLWEHLAKSPELIKSAIEEMIRFDTSVALLMRIANEDITLHGREIKAGQIMMLVNAAANRDPAVFADPNRFDITRTPNKHIGFGVGAHQCLGMNLARMELEGSLRGLLTRFPRMRLDPERLPARKCESLGFRGFARLPVRAD